MGWTKRIPWYVWMILLGTFVFLDGAIFPWSFWSALLLVLYLVAWVMLNWHLLKELW